MDLLTSHKLNNAIEINSEFQSQELEEVELRGRNEKIELFAIVKR